MIAVAPWLVQTAAAVVACQRRQVRALPVSLHPGGWEPGAWLADIMGSMHRRWTTRIALAAATVALPMALGPGAGEAVAGGVMGTEPPRYLVPVDQAVADQDPLARSLRVVQAGLRHDGEQTSLFGSPDRGSGYFEDEMFYRIGPGFRARVSRMDYLVPVEKRRDRIYAEMNINPVVDGHFIEMPHSHLVYELDPRPLEEGAVQLEPPMTHEEVDAPADAPSPHQLHGRLPDGRIDGRIDGRVDGRVGGMQGQ